MVLGDPVECCIPNPTASSHPEIPLMRALTIPVGLRDIGLGDRALAKPQMAFNCGRDVRNSIYL